MERIFLVKNGDLEYVNEWLKKGGKVKMITTVSEAISSYGYQSTNDHSNYSNHGSYVGDIFAYVVIEF